MSQQSTVDIPDNENYFPFHALIAYVYDSEFETLGSTRTRLLSQLRFNPFQTNQNIALSGSNIDLDFSTQIIYVVIISYQRILKRGLKPKIYKENFR